MSSGRIAARVTPAVVAWARHSARLDAEVVAEKAGISVTDLLAWENGTAAPSLAQVRKLATLYKRPYWSFTYQRLPTILMQ
ncbi:MAG: helix-turn-helix transcriptional regulator [Kofleriaceae bacterium]|nr:helix-turn-helix transcriptional regulator [Kofleriaceae bacterium]